MKIAFILPSLDNKGPIIVTHDLIRSLLNKDCECEVFYFDEVKNINFPCKTTRIAFFHKIDFDDYDIIHSHMFRPDLYCAYHRRHIKVPRLITTIHTAINHDLKNAYGYMHSLVMPLLWKWAWSKADHMVVLTQEAKKYYSLPKFKNKISVINNGRDLPKSVEAIQKEDMEVIRGFKDKYTLLGSVASFDKRKGLEQVLRLLKANSNYAYIIIGDGLERDNLQQFAIDNDLSDRFKILGSRIEGFRYISHFDLYLMPSRSEGLSLAMLEAVAQHVPVVCSKIGPFEEIFDGGEVSYFDLDDIASLDSACISALKNREQLIARAYHRYKVNYTVDKMATSYLQLYGND